MAMFVIADLVESSPGSATYFVRNYDGTAPQTVTITETSAVAEEGDLYPGTRSLAGKIIRIHRDQGTWPKGAALQA